jgi:hypothetical protein
MAQFPCSYCGQRYKGAQQTYYPALVHATLTIREKRRACPDCFAHVHEWVERTLVPADGQSLNAPEDCMACGGELDGRIAVFLTIYAAGEDRDDWWGQICGGCVPEAGNALFGAQPRLEGLLTS